MLKVIILTVLGTLVIEYIILYIVFVIEPLLRARRYLEKKQHILGRPTMSRPEVIFYLVLPRWVQKTLLALKGLVARRNSK